MSDTMTAMRNQVSGKLIERAQADGDFLVEVDFPMDSWVVGYLFSFGTEVEVLEPLELRQQLYEYAHKIAAHHKP